MCQMLLSINPEYVESILAGTKLYEYRKFRCRDDVLNVWRQTKQHSGITYSFFRKYYKGKKKAVAYRLKNVVLYDKPLSLEDIGVSCAPQSYCYLSMPG